MKIEDRINEELKRRFAIVNRINPAEFGGKYWDEYEHEMGAIAMLIAYREMLKCKDLTEERRALLEEKAQNLILRQEDADNGQ